MIKVLITRPKEDAESLAASLRERGIDALIDPMLQINQIIENLPPLDNIQAVLLTSANGARALSKATGRRDLVIYSVGEATAAAARKAGFTSVETADGDSMALVSYVKSKLSNDAGPLLHITGTIAAGDIGTMLESNGFTVNRIALYSAEPVTSLSSSTLKALKKKNITHVLLFSPRTARIFSDLVEKAGLIKLLSRVEALCLSPAVAEAATQAFGRKRVAAYPNTDYLLNLLPAAPKTSVTLPKLITTLICLLSLAVAIILGLKEFVLGRLQYNTAAIENVVSDGELFSRHVEPFIRDHTNSALKQQLAPYDLEHLDARFTALEKADEINTKSIDDLTRRSTEAITVLRDIDKRLQDLQGREKTALDKVSERVTLALTANLLSNAAESGRPFVAEWKLLAALKPENSAGPEWNDVLTKLEAAAEKGVPDNKLIENRFKNLVAEIKPTDTTASRDGWVKTVLQEVNKLITIRRLQSNSTSIDYKLDEIKRLLHDHAYPQAQEKMNDLCVDPKFEPITNSFCAILMQRITTDEALAILQKLAIQSLEE